MPYSLRLLRGFAPLCREVDLVWWARQDSNLQPDRYERSALTIELQALSHRVDDIDPLPYNGPGTAAITA